jgi:hypothetical protein
MQKFLYNLTMLAGLMAAAVVWAQEPAESETGNARSVSPRMTIPERSESLRSPPPAFQPRQPESRPSRFSERENVRERLFEPPARNEIQPDLSQQRLRDPRSINYRMRVWPDEPMGRNVPSDLQRAIERAQSEHGGKVLSADRIRYRGQDTYRVKLLTPSGRVRVVQMSEPAAPAVPAAAEIHDQETNDQRKGDE